MTEHHPLPRIAPSEAETTQPKQPRAKPVLRLLGPAFVAAIAYVDPGNVASNLTAGAQFGYLLVWVIVAANLMAALVQYLSAVLGYAARASLTDVLGKRLRRGPRLAFWLQAEGVAMATDLAEVVGGATALYLLFDLPLVLGGCLVGAVSLAMLALTQRREGRTFERVVMGFLVVITIGFCAGLVIGGFDVGGMLAGIVPRFDGVQSVALATAMLGATVMPHAIYLHSALTRDVACRATAPSPRDFLAATRLDVILALTIAGSVNLAMVLLAAANLRTGADIDAIEGAHQAIAVALGGGVATLFAVGLLASGIASTSVGSYAGAEIMSGLLHLRIPMLLRRAITLVPALIVLALPVNPAAVLVISQIVLSLGIPFALVPLVRYTASTEIMGALRVGRSTSVIAWLVAAVIIALNLALLVLLATGAG